MLIESGQRITIQEIKVINKARRTGEKSKREMLKEKWLKQIYVWLYL
jgi:hypothetical protein